MNRLLLAAAFLAGAASLALAAPPDEEKPSLDYSGFKLLTQKPIRVDPGIFENCEPPSGATARQAKQRGPHFVPAVKFFANPAAEKALAAGLKAPLPVGATVVKEKLLNEKDAKPKAYAAMIKREAGFDREHGDWEYVYVEQGEQGAKPVVTRGALKSCVQCHSIAKEKDYLFRTYLSEKRPAAAPEEETTTLDYSSFKTLTPKPILVERSIFLRCAPPVASTVQEQKRRGPHFVPAVKLFANPAAEKALAAGPKAPLPAGATIVKEKLWNEKDAKPTAYTAMIKREPGFDAEHGDWEYLHVQLGDEGEKPVVTRGAIKSCVQCHSIAKEKDYLFRAHDLSLAAKPKTP